MATTITIERIHFITLALLFVGGFALIVANAANPSIHGHGWDEVSCTGCVDSADIANNAVGTDEIANNAVTSSKISDGSVTSADIGNGQVGSNDINPNQVQRRVNQACPAGSTIRRIKNDGSVECQTIGSASLDCITVSVLQTTVPGPAIATCPAGYTVTGGGGWCEPSNSPNPGFSHASQISGNGWYYDCYRHDWAGDSLATAQAICCKIA